MRLLFNDCLTMGNLDSLRDWGHACETSPLQLAHALQPAPWNLLSVMSCMQDASKMHALAVYGSWPPFKSAICQTRCTSSCSCGRVALTAA